MSARPLMIGAVLVTLSIAFAAVAANAQTPPAASHRAKATHPPANRRPPTRIEVGARPLLYRRCTDWYEIQHRPSGTVLFPRTHCWWVRG